MIDIAKRIKAVGEYVRLEKKQKICKVKCQGCGEDILSNADLSDVEYVKTKRGSVWFFHRGCVKEVWKRGIQ